jgi:PAS domain S-box-containing protein
MKAKRNRDKAERVANAGDRSLPGASGEEIPGPMNLEEALRVRNAYVEHLLDSAPDAIIWAEPDHRVFRVNPAFSQLFGYSPAEALGKHIDDLVAPKQFRGEASKITGRVSEGKKVRLETVRCRKDDSPVFVDLMVAPIMIGDHQVGVCASYRDIGERKKAEEGLKDSHRTLLTVLDSIDATIYVADMTSHKILFMNKFMKNIFGPDAVGEICWKVFRGYDAPCAHCNDDRLLDQEGESTGVCIWEGQNPLTGRWYINYDRAIKWIDGRMVRLQVATDITDLKEAESALRREKEYLGALHKTALGLISRLELEELLETIILRATKLVGIPEGYVYLHEPETGELVLRVGSGRYKPMVGFRMKQGAGLAGRVLKSGKPIRVDDYATWPSRSPEPGFDGLHAVVGIPLKSGAKVGGIIGLGSYDSDVKIGETQISILSRFAELASIALDNALLLSKVKEELSQRKLAEEERRSLERKLLHVQKMEAIGTLAAGIAHDFNNLLMGVQGNASLMLCELNESHPHHERLVSIEEYVRRGAELTRQLLGFARGGKYETKLTDLNEVIRKSADLFIRTKKEITFHARYEEDLWAVQVDPGQIEQVLLNLFINAWQSMPGGGTLTVSTENLKMDQELSRSINLPPGNYVRFSVADTGIGMDKDTQERIFEPFFTTKKMGRGTGLGLASAYGIVKNHGGSIDVQSREGEGTVFTIYLPASSVKTPMLD